MKVLAPTLLVIAVFVALLLSFSLLAVNPNPQLAGLKSNRSILAE